MLRRHGADHDIAAVGANAFEVGNAGEIDQVGRTRETELHHGDQSVPPGKRASVLAELVEQADRCGDGCGTMVGE